MLAAFRALCTSAASGCNSHTESIVPLQNLVKRAIFKVLPTHGKQQLNHGGQALLRLPAFYLTQ